MRFALGILAAALAALGLARGEEAFDWRTQQAKPTPAGDLAWSPHPFVLEAGASRRYIDFENGNDANPGTREAPWKRHPWDPAASGQSAACAGIHTFVFKRGVVYRGALVVKASGKPGEPMRLTSDPEWGQGEAVLCGSRLVEGFKQGAEHKDLPEPGKVWWTDLDFAPRTLWALDGAGKVRRIPLARAPNWKVSDPDDIKSEWWHWDYKGAPKHFDIFTEHAGRKLHLGIDTEHLTQPAAYYENAILWTENGWVMGTPYPVRVEAVDTKQKGLAFGGRWGGAAGSYKIVRYNRYFLEDKPHYLDDPDGEFWFEKKGAGGRLYVRVPGGAEPAAFRFEAGREFNLIDGANVSHLHVSALAFRFTNVHWDLDGVPYAQGKNLDPACVRLAGAGKDLRVTNCLFEHVNHPIRITAGSKLGEDLDEVLVADNDIRSTDRGGIYVNEGSEWGETEPKTGLLFDVKILRNRMREVGMRPTRFDQGFGLTVTNARTLEVAGNVLERIYAGGINLFGAKRSGALRDVPLSRMLVHHNKVVDPLLNSNDFGGIETWQGGPAYVYNNISGNPGGYWHYGHKNHPENPGNARFGHAYYLDGAFKNYHFNNIAWGKSKDPLSRLGNTCAFQEIHSYQNAFFNNTVYNFVKGTRRQAPHAGRDKFLGNVWDGIGEWLFWHSQPSKTPEEGNARDAGPQKDHYAFETMAYGRNVIHDIAPDRFGVFEPSGRWLETFDAFKTALQERKVLLGEVGEVAASEVLSDPAHHDFRPAKGSPAIDKGVRAFVPWALYAEVAEWNFYPAGGDPGTILDEHWYLTAYHVVRDSYHERPTWPLSVKHAGADAYVPGPLEDWIAGALALNGTNRYAVLPHAKLAEPFVYEARVEKDKKKVNEQRTAQGEELKNPQVHRSNFLIEVYFKLEPKQAGGVLIEKRKGSGYALTVDAQGRAHFELASGEVVKSVTGTAQLADGAWHHLIAEADRAARKLTLYLDGKRHAEAEGLGPDVSLANEGDLYVGGTPEGRCLSGALDFMRIALGTLADARTTIEELHAWEFNGPFLRDFTGRKPNGKRDAGALEAE
ncbi:MAG: laminin G domain-containing protein [Planctomycetota bacterium]|nr:laminin G domain-containing protein [Planctomycetota bacterium]